MQSPTHWSDRLPTPLTRNESVVIHAEADTDNAGMVVVASRIAGIYDALKTRQTEDHDPLADEHPDDLLTLADHLHRVIGCLVAQEDRVIDALRYRGVSARRIASAMDVDHKTVTNRFARIDRAKERGLNTLGLAEADDQES